MYKGTTPRYTLTFPEDITFESTDVYVTFSRSDRSEVFTKTNDELTIDANVISVFLTQEETLSLPATFLLQVNWTYQEGGVTKRACSNIVKLDANSNLINEVL